MTDLDPPVDPEITAALGDLADWYTRDVGTALTGRSVMRRSRPARQTRRLLWWASAAAAMTIVFAIVTSIEQHTGVVVMQPGGPPVAPPNLQAVSDQLFPSVNAGRAVLNGTRIALYLLTAGAAVMLAVRAGRDRRRLAGAALWGGGLVVLLALTWWTAVAGNPNWLFLGRPGFGYSFLGAAVTAGLTIAVVAGGYLAPAQRKPGGLVLGAVSLLLVGLIVGLGHDAVLRARFAVDRPTLDVLARPQPKTAVSCRPATVRDPPAVLDTVDEICSSTQAVIILRAGALDPAGHGTRTGLLYLPARGSPPLSTCIRPLAEGWYEYSSVIAGDCPANYTFTGGG